MKKLIIASRNENKAQELKAIFSCLDYDILTLKEAGCVIDAQELGKTFKEIALSKAMQYYLAMGIPCISDDSGLCIDAFDGFPGIMSKRFAGANRSDENRNDIIIDTLHKHDLTQSPASYHAAMAYYSKDLHFVVEGVCQGVVKDKKSGSNGFSYDPIFWYKGRTFADMTEEEKNEVSHRGIASRLMIEKLKEINK
jgi:XTP/dITP diphosphohydrolase